MPTPEALPDKGADGRATAVADACGGIFGRAVVPAIRDTQHLVATQLPDTR